MWRNLLPPDLLRDYGYLIDCLKLCQDVICDISKLNCLCVIGILDDKFLIIKQILLNNN